MRKTRKIKTVVQIVNLISAQFPIKSHTCERTTNLGFRNLHMKNQSSIFVIGLYAWNMKCCLLSLLVVTSLRLRSPKLLSNV
jgi:hypothetical protein